MEGKRKKIYGPKKKKKIRENLRRVKKLKLRKVKIGA